MVNQTFTRTELYDIVRSELLLMLSIALSLRLCRQTLYQALTRVMACGFCKSA